MSASLVGSEMCIRDSCGRQLAMPPDSRLADGKGWMTNLVDELLNEVAVAVSYTHLTLPTICSV
eukprot:8950880-Alexandrium_andersonii.AAC.1